MTKHDAPGAKYISHNTTRLIGLEELQSHFTLQLRLV